jgi:hypothetical protein
MEGGVLFIKEVIFIDKVYSVTSFSIYGYTKGGVYSGGIMNFYFGSNL